MQVGTASTVCDRVVQTHCLDQTQGKRQLQVTSLGTRQRVHWPEVTQQIWPMHCAVCVQRLQPQEMPTASLPTTLLLGRPPR